MLFFFSFFVKDVNVPKLLWRWRKELFCIVLSHINFPLITVMFILNGIGGGLCLCMAIH